MRHDTEAMRDEMVELSMRLLDLSFAQDRTIKKLQSKLEKLPYEN